MTPLKPEDFIGKKFGRLTITQNLGCRNIYKRRKVIAICECGVIKEYMFAHIKGGITKSCGCILIENRYGSDFINQPISSEESKICVMCKLVKSKTDFHRMKGKKCGVQSKCKQCNIIYKKGRYWSNHEIELQKHTKSRTKPENILQRKGYYQKNKNDYKQRYFKYISDEEKRERIRERAKKYNKDSYEKISNRAKHYAQREDVKERKRKKHHERKKTDIQYVIKRRLRFRLRNIIKALGNNKYKWMSSTELVGCGMDFLKSYLESKFQEGMSWERLSELHIDHIKPCKKFDLTKLEEQKKCFHYSNLQILWEVDNLKKGAYYDEKTYCIM